MNNLNPKCSSIAHSESGTFGALRADGNDANRQSANDPYFAAAISAAKTRTYRAAVSAGLTPADREDLHQAILLDILERESKFDPDRGSPGTFTGMVSEHRTAEFLTARKKDRSRLTFGDGVDDPNDDDISGAFSMDAEGNGRMWADDQDLFADSMALHDLQTALSYMNDDQVALFRLLESHQDMPAACNGSGMSIATFYRRAHDLKMHLRMFGFRSAA